MTHSLAPFRATGLALWLTGRSLRSIALRLLARDPLASRSLALALEQFLWRPLPALISLGTLAGIITGVLIGRILALYNAELTVIAAVCEVLLKQILPLIIGVFAAGSIAVELAARMAGMSLANEIDALELLGHDPPGHVLGPPALAVLAASPLHMLLTALSALLGTGLPLAIIAGVSWRSVIQVATSAGVLDALLTGTAKVVLFTWLAFCVGAVIGTRPVVVPAQIGQSARLAFNTGLLAIFAAATLWVVLA